MAAWIRGSALTMLTFGTFWGGAIWTWRDTGRAPSTSDLLTCLVALPLAVLAGIVLVRRLAQRPSAPASAPDAAPSEAAAPAPAGARLPALALARREVVEGAGAVPCVGNADPVHRSAVLVRPAAVA